MSTTPTRIGVLSDIHGNATALQAVLADIESVDAIVCAGDIVGYGPSPSQCVSIIRDRDIPTVQGNHDRAVMNGQPYESGDEYAYDTLSDDAIEWLRTLPKNHRLFNDRVKIVHNHPDPDKQGPGIRIRPSDVTSELLGTEEILVLGHTHIQHAEMYDQGIVVNPGSVGQPRDGNPDAAYAVLNLDDHSVELHRVSYDVSRVQEQIRETDIDEANAIQLKEASSLC